MISGRPGVPPPLWCGDYMGQVEWGGKGVQGGILGDMLPGGAIESLI